VLRDQRIYLYAGSCTSSRGYKKRTIHSTPDAPPNLTRTIESAPDFRNEKVQLKMSHMTRKVAPDNTSCPMVRSISPEHSFLDTKIYNPADKG